jgi:DNA polymerase-3 subunit epsilon
MSDRHLIVVDVESTGLDPKVHIPIEVAAINVDTGEMLSFVPHLAPDMLAQADPNALRINRYFERGVYRAALSEQETADMYDGLWAFLRGNTFAGANPRFDMSMLIAGYSRLVCGEVVEPCHHRLADVSSYVAGALGLYPGAIPGLVDCCERLGVTNESEHSALGDAQATVDCFRIASAMHGPREAGA